MLNLMIAERFRYFVETVNTLLLAFNFNLHPIRPIIGMLLARAIIHRQRSDGLIRRLRSLRLDGREGTAHL